MLNSRLHGWSMNRTGLQNVLLEAVSNTRQPRQLSSPQQALSCPAGASPNPMSYLYFSHLWGKINFKFCFGLMSAATEPPTPRGLKCSRGIRSQHI